MAKVALRFGCAKQSKNIERYISRLHITMCLDRTSDFSIGSASCFFNWNSGRNYDWLSWRTLIPSAFPTIIPTLVFQEFFWKILIEFRLEKQLALPVSNPTKEDCWASFYVLGIHPQMNVDYLCFFAFCTNIKFVLIRWK